MRKYLIAWGVNVAVLLDLYSFVIKNLHPTILIINLACFGVVAIVILIREIQVIRNPSKYVDVNSGWLGYDRFDWFPVLKSRVKDGEVVRKIRRLGFHYFELIFAVCILFLIIIISLNFHFVLGLANHIIK